MGINQIELAKKFAEQKFTEAGRKNHFLDVFMFTEYVCGSIVNILPTLPLKKC